MNSFKQYYDEVTLYRFVDSTEKNLSPQEEISTINALETYFSEQAALINCQPGNESALLINLQTQFYVVQQMICKHINGPDLYLKLPDGRKIKGFNMDPIHMDFLVEPKRANVTTMMFERACRILIAFGIKRDPGSKGDYITLIFLRIDGNNDIMRDIAYEYCFPCPDTCPNELIAGHPSYIC